VAVSTVAVSAVAVGSVWWVQCTVAVQFGGGAAAGGEPAYDRPLAELDPAGHAEVLDLGFATRGLLQLHLEGEHGLVASPPSRQTRTS